MEQRAEFTGIREFGGTSITNPSSENPTSEQDPEPDITPSQDEMERERLQAKAEQLQDEIQQLRQELREKEEEFYEVKRKLGITPYTEFKQSVANSWEFLGNKLKGMQETQTYRKIDDKLTGLKSRVEESSAYQKTVSTLSDGSKRASTAISSAGTKIKENETVKSIGEKTSTALKRTGTKISSAASSFKEKVWTSVDHGDNQTEPSDDGTNAASDQPPAERVDPDDPTKSHSEWQPL